MLAWLEIGGRAVGDIDEQGGTSGRCEARTTTTAIITRGERDVNL